jgi:hypothetical protein
MIDRAGTCETCRFAVPIDPTDHWATGIEIAVFVHCLAVGEHWRSSVTPRANLCWYHPPKWQAKA